MQLSRRPLINRRFSKLTLLVVISSCLPSCLPGLLDKYSQNGSFRSETPASQSQNDHRPPSELDAGNLNSTVDSTEKDHNTGSVTAESTQTATPTSKALISTQPTVRSTPFQKGRTKAQVQALDDQTFIYPSTFDLTWDAALKVLLKNYSMTIVDKNSGVINTDWDSFYLGEKVYRNKLTLYIKSIARNQTEVMIHNTNEYLRSSPPAPGTIENHTWLPVDDQNKETTRIAQNLSIVLNLSDQGFEKAGTVARKSSGTASGSEGQDVLW